MSAGLTEAEFSKHLNTPYAVKLGEESIDIELVQVKSYLKNPGDHEGMERFSLFFRGPGKPFLPQHTYSLSHETMGDIDIFLVPIAPDGDGFQYEAVFNYFK